MILVLHNIFIFQTTPIQFHFTPYLIVIFTKMTYITEYDDYVPDQNPKMYFTV